MSAVRALLLDAVTAAVALLAGPVYAVWRALRGKPLAELGSRIFGPEPVAAGAAPLVWVHGVSVGEVLSGRSLVRALQEGGFRVVVSSTTRTGLATARAAYPGVPVRPSPLDFGPSVARWLDRVQPALLILLELELWPRLLFAAKSRGLPVLVASCKISERSARGYRRLQRVLPGFLDGVARFLVQEDRHRDRLLGLGVAAGRVAVGGSLKFDNVPAGPARGERGAVRGEEFVPEGDLLILAGSTHEGEEATVLAAYGALLARFPGLRLWLAPRHPERLPAVADLLARGGYSFGRRSDRSRTDAAPVLLIDTMGELSRLFAACDVAILGGSFVPVGGHNLLEPIAHGVPLAAGPHLDTVRAVASELEQQGALRIAKDARELVPALESWLSDGAARRKAGEAGRSLLDRHRGATRKIYDVSRELLAGRPPLRQED